MGVNKVTVKVNRRAITKKVREATEDAVYDVSDDLVRTSSAATPHWKGQLEKGYGREVAWSGDKVVATVDYSALNEGYDYAPWIHNGDYELGPKSQEKAAGGGGVGMSGKAYPVGNKFLTRVLYGEEQAYTDHIEKSIKQSLK